MGRRRGIEPIVAAILLIIITVVAAVLLYMWFSGYLSTTTSKVSQISVPEELSIVGVDPMPQYSEILVIIQNVGQIPATINQAYLLNISTGNIVCALGISGYTPEPSTASSPTSTTTSAYIPSGSTYTIYLVTSGCSLSTGTSYILKLVTTQGTPVTAQFTYG